MTDKPKKLRREDTPPPGELTWIRRVKGDRPQSYTILSTKLHGFWGHWDGYKTVSCTGDSAEECDGHRRKMPLKWRGYLCCKDHRTGEKLFLELPKGAAVQLDHQYPEGESLRGLRIEINRTSAAAQAHYRVKLLQRIVPMEQLEADEDPEPHVSRLWGCVPRKLDRAPKADQ